MPATSIFMSAASSGTSGIGNSRISILLGPTRTAARTFSAIDLLPFPWPPTLAELGVEARIDAPCISFENLVAACLVESVEGDEVALGVLVMVPGLRIDALDRAQHLRREQDVIDRDDLRQQLDARIVVDAGIEEYVAQQVILEQRSLHLLRQPAISAPVERHRAAAMRNDEPQAREVAEQVALDQLHEGGGVGVEVVRAGVMEIGIAGR